MSKIEKREYVTESGTLYLEGVFVEEPTPGTIWRHHSGRLYRVLFMTNKGDRDDYPRTVVYEGVANSEKWSGPLFDWHRRMTEVPRPYTEGWDVT